MQRIALLLAALLLGGCATEEAYWSARVGHYTYDQAVITFGPPDRSTTLRDGTVVAEWLTQRAHVVAAPEPYFLPPGCYYGPLIPVYTETYVPESGLRLTFDPQGELRAWKRFTR